MGIVHTEITLKNVFDAANARQGNIRPEDVRAETVTAVEVYWKDRFTVVHAMIIPGAEKVLLGAIPLEDMDLIVSPATQEVAGVHGDKVECLVL